MYAIDWSMRAAERARALAQQNGTDLVVSRDGVLEYVTPEALTAQTSVQAPPPNTAIAPEPRLWSPTVAI